MLKQKNRSPLLGEDKLGTLAASLICILIGLAVGFLFLIILAWISLGREGTASFSSVLGLAYNSGFKQLLMGGFYILPKGMGREIAAAAPLIMTGLSVGFAFKTGLFNIGAAGQYTVGAYGALLTSIVLHLPWYLCLIASAIFGALWGAIPGIFKALLNINEVITSIMFNWIGLYGVNTLIYQGGMGVMYDSTRTKTWAIATASPGSVIPDLGLAAALKNKSTTIAIFFAIIIAVIIYIVINKTTFGYELKACGHNKNAAKYAGINEKKNIILSMVIAGALAGIGAGLYYLSGMAEWNPLDSTALPGIGFDGISVALLASSNPIGTIFSAIFISHITTGGNLMGASYFPPEVADFISGIIIYLCAFSLLFKTKLVALVSKKEKKQKASASPVPQETEKPLAENKEGGDEA